MLSTPPVINKEIILERSWKKLSIRDIEETISSDFPGKKEFIEFYLAFNGGCFTNGAYLYSDIFYKNFNRDYLPIEINSFLHIPLLNDNSESKYTTDINKVIERRELLSEDFEEFILFHIPFADNYADNDFWIDIQTGAIKYMDYETSYDPKDAIIVAPLFSEFCKKLQAKRRVSPNWPQTGADM